MTTTQSHNRDQIEKALLQYAPYSILEKGATLVSQGLVSECSKAGQSIISIVQDPQDEQQNSTEHSVRLDIRGKNTISATCSCSSQEQMEEQWCIHAIAACYHASDLDFFQDDSGFEETEPYYRMNTTSPDHIAKTLRELMAPNLSKSGTSQAGALQERYTPEVNISMNQEGDRIGIKVFFDKQLQVPTLFEEFQKKSSRALDNVLLDLLETEGNWDENRELWYLSSSQSIEQVLGMLREYEHIYHGDSSTLVVRSEELLNSQFVLQWQDSAAELSMQWILPDGNKIDRNEDLIGTGPFWVFIDSTIYRLSTVASRMAALFPHAPHMTILKSKCAPILELLEGGILDPQIMKIENANKQPATEIGTPTPQLDLDEESWQRNEDGGVPGFTAQLSLEYPEPPEGENLVYLPDREKEIEFHEHLLSLGFESKSNNLYRAHGDSALDLLFEQKKPFPTDWKVSGLRRIRRGLKKSELQVDVSVSKDDQERFADIDWFECRVTLTQNNSQVPISSLFKNNNDDLDRWIQLDGGSYAKIPGGGLKRLKSTLGAIDPNFSLSNSIRSQLTPAQALGLSRLEDEGIRYAIDKTLRTVANKLSSFEGIPKIKPGKGFTGKLRSYQTEGLRWMNFLNEYGLGGILADEMGLGKTVQTLSLLQYLKDTRSKERRLSGPSLVVAPTSVTRNWSDEAERFAPGMKTLLLQGPARKPLFRDISDYDLVITSYALLRLDQSDLRRFEFDYIILDEAQNIKNPVAATTKAACSLKAKHRLALTGTPTENRPLELWSIFNFLMPGYLGTAEYFRNAVERPILEGGPGVRIASVLKARTKPFLLRRTKAEVEKELPPKIESALRVEMTESQKQIYSQILSEVRTQVQESIEEKGIGGSQMSILAALLRLRQICNHPNSIDALKDISGYDSGKFYALQELLKEAIGAGRKILLFSQFRAMHKIIREWFDSEGIRYCVLDGSTRNRHEVVEEFQQNEEVKVFLISLKAGGTGLNLTAADTVVLYDPWWNPAVEAQAVDRAHRIGQSKAVSVYRLITEDSVEQKIMDLQKKKSAITDALINENGISSGKLTKEDLEHLFGRLE